MARPPGGCPLSIEVRIAHDDAVPSNTLSHLPSCPIPTDCCPGTYARTSALDALVHSFLSDGAPKQIISLGAGTDTRALRLFSGHSRPGLVYHEFDYQVVCDRKRRTIQNTPLLAKLITDISVSDDGSWRGSLPGNSQYHCHGIDLRQLSGSPDSSPAPSIPGLRTDIPTLLLSECCLCYLSPSAAGQVLEFFTSSISNLAVVLYEPIRPDDAFGKMMVSNLAARNISMPTVDVYRQGKDQETRLRLAGFQTANHMTIEDIWEKWIKPDERERVDRLEGLDEVEEWKLLASHYVVVWGSKGTGFDSWAEISS